MKIDDKNYSQINDKNDNQLNERSKKSKILDSIREADKKPHEQLNKTNFNDELTKLRIYLSQKDSIDRSDQDDESKYQDGGSRLYVQGSDLNVQGSDLNVQGSDKRLNVDLLSEETRSGRRFDDGNLKNGNFQYDKLTNSNSSSNDTVECSHECSAEQFLSFSVRVIDPHNRKWATIMITSLYYINSLVMLCLFLGVSFHFIDLLIVSSFIEGGKLFVCFVLLMIDIFNGKSMTLSLFCKDNR